ncbi:hypothetical protein M3Y97_00565900 [Aphelenchoides bicaudatus]|nr:hypothetical protein M3Y97_00565900 [Aphelenchoides bicaudatus]
MLLERLIVVSTGNVVAARSVSSKYTKPHPRQYRRRLFEAAVLPILPEKDLSCGTWKDVVKQREIAKTEFMPIEYALVKKIRKWIQDEGFRTMAVCQQMSMKERPLHFVKNSLRLKGIHYAGYTSRIMGKLFEGTPLQALEPLIYGHENSFLFGYDVNSIKVMINETARIPQIIPLAFTFDSRILSMDEAGKLAKLSNVGDLRAETVQILQKIPADLTQSLGYPARDLVTTLSRVSQ